MSELMFPVLKDDISVREQEDGALFLTRTKSTYELRSPFEAFLILLFDGQHSVADVSTILSHMKSSPEVSHIEQDVLDFIEDNRHILDLSASPCQNRGPELDPFAFLRKNHLFTRPARCSGP